MDRENRFLIAPTKTGFEPWGSFRVQIEAAGTDRGPLYTKSAEHYYHYWQVHQVHAIQKKYPVFASHNSLLANPSSKTAAAHTPDASDSVATLGGNYKCFDALSFYTQLSDSQRHKTFASVPVTHGIKRLSDDQLANYKASLRKHAQYVSLRYELNTEKLYQFLVYLLHLQDEYQEDERAKLDKELCKDIIMLTELIHGCTGQSFADLEEEVGKRQPFWTRKQFRHLDKLLEVRDCAQETLTHFVPQYNSEFPNNTLSSSDIESLLEFLNEKGLFIFTYAIFDIQEILNNPVPFPNTQFYINLSNLTTGFACLLREIASAVTSHHVDTKDLFNLIRSIFVEWGSDFDQKHQCKKQIYKTDNISYIDDVYTDPSLDSILKCFLVTHQARNFLAHKYVVDDDLYRDFYQRVYIAVLFATFYSWRYASANSWI